MRSKTSFLKKSALITLVLLIGAFSAGCGINVGRYGVDVADESAAVVDVEKTPDEVLVTGETSSEITLEKRGDVVRAGAMHVIQPTTSPYTFTLPVEDVAVGVDAMFTIEVLIDRIGQEVYSGAEFYAMNDKWIDDCLPYGETTYITSRAKVVSDNGNPVLRITVKNSIGLTIHVSDPICTVDELPKKLFGGATLCVMPAKSYDTTCSYVFISSDGQVIVYDGGNRSDYDYLIKFLYTLTSEVDCWIVSHFHSDHTGALMKTLENDAITINKLVYSFPTAEQYSGRASESEIATIETFKSVLAASSCVKSVVTPEKNDIFVFGDLTFTALNSINIIDNNFGNNTTIVYRVDTAGEKVLLLGDAGEELGDIIAAESANNKITECSVVQAAHHGQKGVKDDFYELVMPKVMLFPTPMWEFWGKIENLNPFDDRFDIVRLRKLMRELQVCEKILASNGLQILN